MPIRRNRRSALSIPSTHEGLLHLANEGPGHLHVSVEPRNGLVTRVVVHGHLVEAREVFVSSVSPGHEGQLAIDDHELSVVALLQAEHIDLLARLDRVDRENLDVVFFSQREEQRVEAAEDFFVRVEGVDHESNLHAGACALNELHDQELGEIAGPDHVELNVDRRRSLLERSKEPVARFFVVELRVKRVALDEL